METVFKVGQKVYDEVNFPDKEGVVIDTNKNNKLNLLVKFDNVNYLYTLKGIYLGCKGTPTLSTKPYKIELQGFEQKASAPTFKEALDWLKNNKDYRTTYRDDRIYPSNEIYVAFEVLRKLIILRDYYNEGWKPQNNSYVHIITTRNGELVKDCLMGDFRVLYFESKEIRNTFFEEQRELLEIAKPLL